MREALALVRVAALSAASYRLRMILSLGSLLVTVVPVYFIAGALQETMADVIRGQGTHYFGFLIVGMAALALITTAISALPGAVGSGVGTGTLEALLATRTPMPALLAGLTAYPFLWTCARVLLMLTLGALLGARLAMDQALVATGILALIVLAYLPVGLLAAAFMLAFRTAGPLPQAAIVLSGLLGGVYYPVHVIPSWIEQLAELVPLTYGLRALRATLLDGAPLAAVTDDLTVLTGFILTLGATGVLAFHLALRYARRSGTLAQY